MDKIILTKEEEVEFSKWLKNKGYTKAITMNQMVSEYYKFVAFKALRL